MWSFFLPRDAASMKGAHLLQLLIFLILACCSPLANSSCSAFRQSCRMQNAHAAASLAWEQLSVSFAFRPRLLPKSVRIIILLQGCFRCNLGGGGSFSSGVGLDGMQQLEGGSASFGVFHAGFK